MIVDIDKYVNILITQRISAHQFLILWLVHHKDRKNLEHLIATNNISKHDISYLVDINLLQDWNNGQGALVDYIVTEKFTRAIFVDEDDAYEQLCSVYPPWMIVKGTKWPMIKGDPYKIGKEYFKCHKGSRSEHERIMNITIKYFKTKPVMGNIEDYILNRRWNLLEKELDKSGGGQDAIGVL